LGQKGASSLEFLLVLLACVAFVFGFVRPYVAEVLLIPSGSMTPTLEPGDHVLANKLAYRFSEPHRGNLAVFRSSEDRDEIAIKRVIGLPGDTIVLEDGQLWINGELQKEPYVDRRVPDTSFYGPATVPEGHVFVMGDNRANSVDSRFLGPVSEEDLLGRALLRLWPPGRAKLL